VDARTIGTLDEDAARGLVQTAQEMGVDVIVVGTHGLGTLGRLALGSVATGVVQHATCSVLVVR
jgi:nucleotide-binding universal stress UspA family protein